MSKSYYKTNRPTWTQGTEKGTANLEHFENKNVFPKQAGTINCFVRSWLILTSEKGVLETVTGMPTNLNTLPQGNMIQTILRKKETVFVDEEVRSLLKKGVKSHHGSQEIVSSIFLK